MRTVIAFSFLLFIAATPASQPARYIHIKDNAPDSVKAYVSASMAYRTSHLQELEQRVQGIHQDIVDMRNGRIDRNRGNFSRTPRRNGKGNTYTFGSVEERRGHIEKRIADLKETESWVSKFSDPAFLPTIPREFETFKVGFIGGIGGVKVVQVIDPQNMIADARFVFMDDRGRNYSTTDVYIWITSFSTSTITDGSFIELPGVWGLLSTKQFATTNGGSKTVPLAAPIPVDQFIEVLER